MTPTTVSPEMIAFFDRHAPMWDSYQRPCDFEAIERILNRAALKPTDRLLDVGAGTGVLAPFLEKRGLRHITAIDASPNMTDIYRQKFPHLTCHTADFHTHPFAPGSFDIIMIFNSFPHFEDTQDVFNRSASLLTPGGRLFICHSMSRDALNEHHRKAGGPVEEDILISDDAFREHFQKAGFNSIVVDNGAEFFSCGTRS